jgi:hypothetical protein
VRKDALTQRLISMVVCTVAIVVGFGGIAIPSRAEEKGPTLDEVTTRLEEAIRANDAKEELAALTLIWLRHSRELEGSRVGGIVIALYGSPAQLPVDRAELERDAVKRLNLDVKSKCLVVISALGTPEAREILRRALEDDNMFVRRSAEELSKPDQPPMFMFRLYLSVSDSVTAVVALLGSDSKEVRMSAVNATRDLFWALQYEPPLEKKMVDQLILAYWRDGSWECRVTYVRALARVHNEVQAAKTFLVKVTDRVDENEAVRGAALDVLQSLGKDGPRD